MYPVSSAFIEAMKSPSQEYNITGTVRGVEYDQSNILAGAFTITNQCSDNQEVTLGSVYIGELAATFVNVNVDRYQWYGAEITAYFAPVGFDPIPLGVFTVAEANWTASGMVVKAYDNMSKFDVPASHIQFVGTPYSILSYICGGVGVPLGMTEAQIEAFPNGSRTMSTYEENDIETRRDVISWLATTLGSFATIDRTGALVFRQFTQTPVDTITDSLRYTGASFSDYVTRYTGMSYTDVEDLATHYFNVEPDDGLTYNIGTNPFMQYGLRETRDAMAEEILQALQGIQYVPFKATSPCNPAYDLGDVIRFSGGLADSTKLSCVTQFTFKYNGGYEMTGVGKNPSLASGKSKVDKNLSGILSRIDTTKTQIYAFVNTSAINAYNNQETALLSISFATISDDAKIDIWIELNLGLTLSANPASCRFKYYLNTELLDYSPLQTLTFDGSNIFSLHYYIGDCEENTRYTFMATITMADGEAFADIGSIHAVLRGDGLAAEGEGWDGNIQVFDEMQMFNPIISLADFTDSATTWLHTPMPVTASDSMSDFNPVISLQSFTDSAQTSTPMMIFSPWINADQVTTDASYNTTNGWIGSGSVDSGTSKVIQTAEVVGVTGAKLSGTINALAGQTKVLVSPDSGSTWYGLSSGSWVQNYKMNPAEIQNVTSAQWAQMDSTVFKVFLGSGDYLYTIDVYGANNNVQALDYYIMDKNEGNADYDADIVSLTDYWQMITEYDLPSVSESIDSGYMKAVVFDFDQFASVSNISLESYVTSYGITNAAFSDTSGSSWGGYEFEALCDIIVTGARGMSRRSETITLYLYDMSGNVLESKQVSVTSGVWTDVTFDTEVTVTAGTHCVVIIGGGQYYSYANQQTFSDKISFVSGRYGSAWPGTTTSDGELHSADIIFKYME